MNFQEVLITVRGMGEAIESGMTMPVTDGETGMADEFDSIKSSS